MALLSLLTLLASRPVLAQDSAAEPTADSSVVLASGAGSDLLLVISGGISRGSYQAGQMYVLSSWLRELGPGGVAAVVNQQRQGQVASSSGHVTVAGSSAGSINAMLTALVLESQGPLAAGAPWEPPEASLHFKTWIPLGFDGTDSSLDGVWCDRSEDHTRRECIRSQQSLINPALLDAVVEELATSVASAPVASGFQTRLVFTAARHQPIVELNGVASEVTLSFGFQLDELAQPTPLSIYCADSRTGDVAHCGPERQWAGPSLTRAGQPSYPLAKMAKLAIASSSIPFAFPLFKLPCEDLKEIRADPSVPCGQAEQEEVTWLMDGGTFEGNPVRVARPFAVRSQDAARAGEHPPLVFMDPDIRPRERQTTESVDAMFKRYRQILGMEGASSGIVSSARNQSVSLYMQDNPGVLTAERILFTRTAPYGSYLSAFLSFYERSFRVFDFYAGMYDALTWLREAGYGDYAGRIPASSLYADVIGCMKGHERPEACSGWTPATAGTANPRADTTRQINALRAPLKPGAETPAALSDEILWNNLMLLALLHARQRAAEQEGKPWDLDDLAWYLDRGYGALGRFKPQDLGRNQFSSELSERVAWQISRVYKRDIVADGAVAAFGLSAARQIIAGRTAHGTLGVGSPIRRDALGALEIGGGALLRSHSRVGLSSELVGTFEVPNRAYSASYAVEPWGWAGGARLSVGPSFGFRPNGKGDHPAVLGPGYLVHVSPGLFGQLLWVFDGCKLTSTGIRPPHWPSDVPGAVRTGGAALRVDVANVLYVDTRFYRHFSGRQAKDTTDETRDFTVAFALGVTVPLKVPFSLQESTWRR